MDLQGGIAYEKQENPQMYIGNMAYNSCCSSDADIQI